MMIENCEIQLSVSRTSPQDVEVVLWPRRPLNELQQRFPDMLLANVANVVNHGGFCGRAHRPVASSLQLQESQPASGSLRRRFRIQGIDPGAWRVILGAFLAHSVRGFPLDRLEIRSLDEASGSKLSADEAFATPYPEAPEQLPFPVERSELGSSTKDRLIRITFQREPEEDVVEELIAAVLSWDELALGGYPAEGESPLENATDAVEAYLIDPLTVEHPLPIFAGTDLAFEAVICMAWWFHERGHRVAQFNLW